jgi:hypothetical protein
MIFRLGTWSLPLVRPGVRRRVTPVALVCCIANIGCTTTQTMSNPTSRHVIEQLARATFERPVTIEARSSATSNGRASYEGTIASLAGGKILLTRPRGYESISMEDVRCLEVVDRKIGAREGILPGMVAGAIIGSIVGVLVKNSGAFNEDDRSTNQSNRPIAFGALGGIVVGAGIGATVGYWVGHRTTFDFGCGDSTAPTSDEE